MSLSEIIRQQKQFYQSGKTRDVTYTLKQLTKIKQVIKANESLIYDAIMADFGKSVFETYTTELGLIYHELKILKRHLKKWRSSKKISTDLANWPGKSYLIPEPLGNTLIIGAWNYPYQLSLLPALTALAAGNTVILKPSEIARHTSRIMAQIINQNFPSGLFHVVEGGVIETTELLKNHFDKIFFTGSTHVGRIVYQAAAKNLTPVTLELGGKSPTFVLKDAPINITAKRIVWAKFLNAGQTCVAPDYILVDKSIESNFLKALRHEIERQYNFKANLPENYVRIINKANFERLHALIEPKKVYYGGQILPEQNIIKPTILHSISFEDSVMKDEIFGPILPVISYTDLNQVIHQVKNMPKPLACYVYGKNQKDIDKIINNLSFGGGMINDSVMYLTNPNLPFGGVGFSGMGSYHGKAGFDAFTHYKSLIKKTFWFEPPFKYLPYKPWKLKILKWIFE